MAQKHGYRANEEVDRATLAPCLVCDDPAPTFSWTDYSGEGYCCQCGTPYQLKWGTLADGETYPRLNVSDEWLPIFRRFWAETHQTNGAGTFMRFDDYPDQLAGAIAFREWRRMQTDLPPSKDTEQTA